jgi:hypothetical protein
MTQFGILYKNEDVLLFKQWLEGDFIEETMILTNLHNDVVGEFSDTSIAIIELQEVTDGISFTIKSKVETDIDLNVHRANSLDQLEDFDDMIELVISKFRQNYGEHYGYTIH